MNIKIKEKEYALMSGDMILTRPEPISLYTHFGIILIKGTDIYVLHNTPYKGSIIEPIEDFLSIRNLSKIEPTELNYFSPDEIYRRFTSACKKNYHLLAYNCEHFVDCMLYRDQESEQLRRWGRLFLGAFAFLKITKRI